MVRACYLSRFKASIHLSFSRRSKPDLPLQMPSLDLLLSRFRSLHNRKQKKPVSPKHSHTQPQSLFFSKLPLEIRHIIYSFSVSPYKHVNILDNSYSAGRGPWLSGSAEYAERHTKIWHHLAYYECKNRPKRQEDRKNLSLVCRRM